MEAWSRLERRDRFVLIGGVIVVAMLVGYALAWQPIAAQRELLVGSVAEQRQLLEWMQASAKEVEQLRSRDGGVHEAIQGSLLGAVDRSAKGAGLAKFVRRIEPQGGQAVRVTLEDVSFDQAVTWLGELQARHGIGVDHLGVEGTGSPGKVNMRLKLGL